MPMSDTATVVLKPRRAKPFFMHHPWVFSGAVGGVQGAPRKGGVVVVRDTDGRFVGRGVFNPDSQIMVRLLSWREDEAIDDGFWRRKLEAAVRLRHEVLRLPQAANAYRLVFSESDGLPGLIVDRYGDYLVTQFQSAGLWEQHGLILDVLSQLLSPRGILNRSDEETSEKEGMQPQRGLLRGQAPEGPVEVAADGVKFLVDIAGGQKTGFFLDQRENRLAAARYLKGRSILDAFSYTGAFSLTALTRGEAKEALLVDRSEPALALAARNAELNGVTVETRAGQVAEVLRDLKKNGRRFSAVILDPPKFARSAQGLDKALRAYRDINLMAMQLLEEDGILVTCSCSGHVQEPDFLIMLNDAAVESGVTLQILERRHQSSDHPIISSCLETAYLKCVIARVTR